MDVTERELQELHAQLVDGLARLPVVAALVRDPPDREAARADLKALLASAEAALAETRRDRQRAIERWDEELQRRAQQVKEIRDVLAGGPRDDDADPERPREPTPGGPGPRAATPRPSKPRAARKRRDRPG